MKRILIALALIVVAAAGGWYWASPWWTLQSMRNAAEARDVTALSRHVDYPVLRENLKRRLRARMESGGSGVLGGLVSRGLADQLVDIALTPQGLSVIFAAAPLAADPEPGRVQLKASEMVVERDGIGRFRMVRKDGKPGALIFRLSGPSWLLSDIELPEKGLN
ncbi:MAG: DUF2939 domain-containing protein [Sphingomonadales bacterium]|nr:MAG: DUF2939 domain-containing protein [Sphingomonadales bacterium]